MLKKSKRTICVGCFLVLSVFCFCQNNDPPFSKGVYLNYNGIDLIMGYSTLKDSVELLGEPEESTTRKYGGEDFYWENLLINRYNKGKLRLIFSIDKERLIQIVYLPEPGQHFITFESLTEKSSRSQIIAYLEKNQYKYTTAGSTIWIEYYSSVNPRFNLMCGFQFNNDQTIYALNYQIDDSW